MGGRLVERWCARLVDSDGSSRAAIQKHDENRHACLREEISLLQAAAKRADRLEKENRSLLRELEELRKKQASDPAPPRPALAPISANSKATPASAPKSTALADKESSLERRYSKLAKEHAALEERFRQTHQAARKFRDSRDDWVKYANSLEAKVKKLEKKLQRHRRTTNPPSAPSPVSEPAPTGNDNRETVSGREATGADCVSRPDSASPSPYCDVAPQLVSPRRASSAPATAVSQNHDRVKKEADEETQEEARGDDELPPVPPDVGIVSTVAIKEEPPSDDLVIVSERPVRKRKHVGEGPGEQTPPRRIKSEESNSSDLIVTAEVATFQPHESIDLDEEQRGMPTPKKRRPAEWQHLREEEGPNEDDGLPLEPHPDRARPVPSTNQAPSPASDAPADRHTSGITSYEMAGSHTNRRRPTKADWRLGSGIADLAEDTPEPFHSPKPRSGGEASRRTAPAQGRLRSLLDGASPEKHDALLRPNRPGRLRDRPLAELRLEDFKVNPDHNGGYRHAFDEVVRNKGERAELAGCTDPNCCGRKFRAMAESELRAGGPAILWRPADVKMLQEYLGDAARRLAGMSREEREELWLKAKTQDLADRYGRHRHRFARRPSPPGYWNPDFPSTQEIEQSKAESERMERRLVEERWREAMRGGGRWLFRDE